MATTTTVAAVAAIVKTRYPKGEVPLATMSTFPSFGVISKFEDERGDPFVVPLIAATNQASGTSISAAQAALNGGSTYARFTPSTVEHYTVCRIALSALRKVQGEGALVNLLKTEMDNSTKTELANYTVYLFGDGSGVRGRIASGQGTATIVLTEPTDAFKFPLGMEVKAVSSRATNATVRALSATVTGVDYEAGTVTSDSAWDAQITSLSTDYLTRASDQVGAVTASTFAVPIGLRELVVGGASPAALWGLTRTANPVAYAGTAMNATGLPLDEAIIQAQRNSSRYGTDPPDTLFAHPDDIATLRKSLNAKVVIEQSEAKGARVGLSFKTISIQGARGPVEIIEDPYCDKTMAYLGPRKQATWHSVGPSPGVIADDGNNSLRTPTEAAVEAWIGSPACQVSVRNPGAWTRLYNFGA